MNRQTAVMQAITINGKGGPECLAVTPVAIPVPQHDEVLIRVAAGGLNRGDIAQRQGWYPPPPGVSEVPGLEVSGIVEAVGSSVSQWTVGDRVCALLAGGGYAEYCVAPAAHCLPVPAGMSLVDAAALPETFCTVWGAVFEVGRMAVGETLLVHGGSSGIGVAAIQMAAALGHRVYVTAGSDAKCDACIALGAHRAINYRTQDFVEQIQDEAGDAGVDVVLDMVGGDYVARNIKVLADHGRLVFISALGGEQGVFNIREVMRRRLTITGSTLRSRPASYKARIVAALRDRVWPLIEAGQIRPVIDSTFPLAEAAHAQDYMEQGAHIGKLLLTTDV